jgi:hypothetical protein
MKKLLLLLIGFGSVAFSAKAQATFTTPHDTINATYYGGILKLPNNITNITANPLTLSWNVVSTNFPASWTTETPTYKPLGICDNKLCYNSNLVDMSSKTTNPYPVNTPDVFYMELDLSQASATGSYYMTINLRGGSYSKQITYVINKWSTSVGTTPASLNNVSVYPNPARDYVNVSFDADAGVRTIGIYNLIGKAVSTYRIQGSSARLDLDNMPAGVYFLRMMDAQGRVLATRKITHQ